MNVIVIGGGLIAVTTAFVPRLRRHDVTIEREEGPGRETHELDSAADLKELPLLQVSERRP